MVLQSLGLLFDNDMKFSQGVCACKGCMPCRPASNSARSDATLIMLGLDDCRLHLTSSLVSIGPFCPRASCMSMPQGSFVAIDMLPTFCDTHHLYVLPGPPRSANLRTIELPISSYSVLKVSPPRSAQVSNNGYQRLPCFV